MPRFTLRDMFLATTLIALGLVQLLICSTLVRADNYSSITFLLAFLAPVTIGTGAGVIFQQRILGAWLGALVGLAIEFSFLVGPG